MKLSNLKKKTTTGQHEQKIILCHGNTGGNTESAGPTCQHVFPRFHE